VIKADNDVLDGIRLVGEFLTQGRIVIASSCKSLIKEFYSYVWDEKAGQRGEDKPVKQSDHALDALRYFVFTMTYRLAKIKRKEESGF
jgi:phage terminase large subunit